jgi:hypothetical protein
MILIEGGRIAFHHSYATPIGVKSLNKIDFQAISLSKLLLTANVQEPTLDKYSNSLLNLAYSGIRVD